MKPPVREPDAGKPHVRFDEEGRETRDGPFGEWTPDPKGRKRWGAAGPVHDRARPSLYFLTGPRLPRFTQSCALRCRQIDRAIYESLTLHHSTSRVVTIHLPRSDANRRVLP